MRHTKTGKSRRIGKPRSYKLGAALSKPETFGETGKNAADRRQWNPAAKQLLKAGMFVRDQKSLEA